MNFQVVSNVTKEAEMANSVSTFIVAAALIFQLSQAFQLNRLHVRSSIFNLAVCPTKHHGRPSLLSLRSTVQKTNDDWELTDAGRRELKDLEGNWNKICVLGGSKGVGKEIVSLLSARGVNVVALVRKEDSKSELEALPGVKAVIGDALQASDVISVLDGCDAAISTLGGVSDDKRVDYKGNMNMIENAGILGVTRMVLITSVGTGDSKDAISDRVYEALKPALVDKTKAENLLLKYYTNTDYTIIRPGGLITAPPTGTAILTEDKKASGAIHRADVAKLAVAALYSKKCSKKILTAVDPALSETPSAYTPFQL